MLIRWVAACAAVGFGLFAGGAAAEGYGDRGTLERLSGVWASSGPEPWYGGYGTRRFSFEGGRWALVFTHALDPAMTKTTFRFRTGGAYRVGAESAAVPGAFAAVFEEASKHVTLLMEDPGLIAKFGMAGCGLSPGVEKDISASGCANWKPVSVCGEDHDLFAIDAKGLYFGVRPRDNDMCTADKRPTALLMPVVRQ